MDLIHEEEVDSLASLEERIRKAVDLVTQLRADKDSLQREIDGFAGERQALLREVDEAKAQATRLSQELDSLRSERKQVRTRIEKLLGQMDLLSTS